VRTDRPRPIVAVIPFGARGASSRAGAWARQIARRLVDRFATDATVELRPVFLVAIPEASDDAGYLVFGSSPEPDLAAQYASSLGATHALTATYREEKVSRTLDAALVDAATRKSIATATLPIAPGRLQQTEPDLAAWLVGALGVGASTDVAKTAAATEEAYAALLEAMDEEVNATLLRASDPARARESLRTALARYIDAARLDPDAAAPEERLLVIAAESLERGDTAAELTALERLIEARPRSWRAHYILGQLRAEGGDASGAVVAFEHAHSLHPLPDTDLVRLAELYANAAAPAPALAHLRRIAPASAAYGSAQELLAIISFQRGDLAAGREAFANAVAAGATSWELHASYGAALHARGETGDAVARYRDAIAAGSPGVVRLNLARVLLAGADRDAALGELDMILSGETTGEVAGQARRLRFGLREPELEKELERAGQAALAGDATVLDAAHQVFERALGVDPDLWEARFGLGIVARQRGDATVAQSSFRQVLELQPEAALRALDHAAALRPQEPAYIADAGFAHLRAGDLVSARQRLERAAHLDADDPITKSYLGELERAEAGKRA